MTSSYLFQLHAPLSPSIMQTETMQSIYGGIYYLCHTCDTTITRYPFHFLLSPITRPAWENKKFILFGMFIRLTNLKPDFPDAKLIVYSLKAGVVKFVLGVEKGVTC